MGLYRRNKRRKDGSIRPSKVWWMGYIVDGRQHCESTGTSNKRIAQQILDTRNAEIARGQFDLLKKAPELKDWADKYLESVDHPNTKRRYTSSGANLVSSFGEATQLDHISSSRIEQFKRERRKAGVKAATINRDLRFLAQILKQAERERYIGRSPFDLGKFFGNESRERRKPLHPHLGGARKIIGSGPAASLSIYSPWGGKRDENRGNASIAVEGHRLFERCSTGRKQQDVSGN